MKIRDLLASAVCLAMALADRAAEIPVAPPSASSRIAQIKQRGSHELLAETVKIC